MKTRSPIEVVVLAVSLVLSLTAQSEVIVYDGFDYASGELLDGKGYPGFSWGTNVWTDFVPPHRTSHWLAFPGSLSYPSIPTTGGHIAETNDIYAGCYRRVVTHVIGDGDSVWFSLLVKLNQEGNWWRFYFTSGKDANGVGVAGDPANNTVQAMLGYFSDFSTNEIYLGLNTTRLVVGRYLYSASSFEQMDIWVDPDLSSEPKPGGLNTSNHIVHTDQLDSVGEEPDRINTVVFEGILVAFDELRLGTSWSDVTSRSVDSASIEEIAVDAGGIKLNLSRLTPGATTTVERASQLVDPVSWVGVDTFVPWARATNWTEPIVPESSFFYRVRTQ